MWNQLRIVSVLLTGFCSVWVVEYIVHYRVGCLSICSYTNGSGTKSGVIIYPWKKDSLFILSSHYFEEISIALRPKDQ